MQAKDILQSDLLDIVFDDRNKEYGAYELRKKYDKRIAKALSITALLLLIAFLSSFISRKETEIVSDEARTVFKTTQIEKVEDIIPPPPVPPKPPVADKIKVEKFLPPLVVDKVDVEPPPINNNLEGKTIDGFEQEGTDPNGFHIEPPEAAKEGLFVGIKEEDDEKKIFLDVQEHASVDTKAWRNHLGRYLEPVIENAAEKGMSPGTYTIHIRFLVERDGSITDVTALSDPGYGLASEAIKVVKKGPQWSPGRQNGKNVRSYHTQPITFLVPEN